MIGPEQPVIDVSSLPPPESHELLTHELVRCVAAGLRTRLGAEPTVDQVAEALGYPSCAVLAVLAAASAESLEEGMPPRPARAE